MQNLVLLSDLSTNLNTSLGDKMKSVFAKKSFKLAYIPSRSDRERKYFKSAEVCFRSLGVDDILYFDVDEEYDESLLNDLNTCDGIYLSGGNTYYFLKSLQQKKMLGILRDLAYRGTWLIGVSAGSILMSHSVEIAGYIDENIVQLNRLDSLGLVDFEFMPHWESQLNCLEDLLKYSLNKKKTIFTCHNRDGLVVEGDKIEFYGDICVIKDGRIKEKRG